MAVMADVKPRWELPAVLGSADETGEIRYHSDYATYGKSYSFLKNHRTEKSETP